MKKENDDLKELILKRDIEDQKREYDIKRMLLYGQTDKVIIIHFTFTCIKIILIYDVTIPLSDLDRILGLLLIITTIKIIKFLLDL